MDMYRPHLANYTVAAGVTEENWNFARNEHYHHYTYVVRTVNAACEPSEVTNQYSSCPTIYNNLVFQSSIFYLSSNNESRV